jgi:hypothetical protein
VQGQRDPVRVEVDVREAGLRHLLPHEFARLDEVLDQAGRREVQAAPERLGLREQLHELL